MFRPFSPRLSFLPSARKTHGRIFSLDPSGSSEDAGLTTDTPDEDAPRSRSIHFKESTDSESSTDLEPVVASRRVPFQTQISTNSNSSEESQSSGNGNRFTDSTDIGLEIFETEFSSEENNLDDEDELANTSLKTQEYRSRANTLTMLEESKRVFRRLKTSNKLKLISTNDEIERKKYLLYFQRNSRTIFAGVIEENQINDEFLKNLVSLVPNF